MRYILIGVCAPLLSAGLDWVAGLPATGWVLSFLAAAFIVVRVLTSKPKRKIK